VLDESTRPSRVGGHGLTDCQNLTYRRFGAWGKRSGSGIAYQGYEQGLIQSPFTSGIRWYRAQPSQLTELVVSSNGALFTGDDPGTETNPTVLAKLVDFNTVVDNAPTRFCAANDPIAYNGDGGDVLIMVGANLANMSYAFGHVTVGGSIHAGDTATITLTGGTGGPVTTTPYTVLPTDTLETIATALADALNASLYTPGLDFAPAISAGAKVTVAAAVAGAGGNSYQINGTATGSGLTLTPSSATNFTGGGTGPSSGPLKYDGTNVLPLSPYITNSFRGCVTWHDHVWYWGDPNNPDTLFASDIDQPEGWTFMTEFGGYDIGIGDGDPAIRAVVPIGNILYVFKTNSIYALTGYDFQSGDYQFQVQPAVQGRGTSTQECVAILRNSLVFWDGAQFERLAVGAFETEHIGQPIPLTCAQAANGHALLMRAVAGDFLAETWLNDVYDNPPGNAVPALLSNLAFFATDYGGGNPNKVLVYDDDASIREQSYAWAPWTGWQVGYWIPFGHGPSSGGNVAELPQLFWLVPPSGLNPPQVMQFGQDPLLDSGGKGIVWFAQTGYINFEDFSLIRELHQIFVNVEATAGATISCRISTTAYNTGAYNNAGVQQDPTRVVTFATTTDPPGTDGGIEQENVLLVDLETHVDDQPAGFVQSNGFLLKFTEPGSAAGFELNGAVLVTIENPWTP